MLRWCWLETTSLGLSIRNKQMLVITNGGTMPTGPFYDVQNNAGSAFGFYKMSYRSDRDADGNLILGNNPFILARTVHEKFNGSIDSSPLGTNGLAYFYLDPQSAQNWCGTETYTKAYDRFADKVWGDAQLLLAVDLAERGETLAMLGNALRRLAEAAYLIRHRKFKRAMRALRATPPGKDFKPSDEFFANWMALRYGWGPTLGSVHSLCEVLANPIKGKTGLRVSGSATNKFSQTVYNRWTWLVDRQSDWTIHVRISGKVEISDPRLASLNQYGLVNPAVIAWELVSKSFVVGWFLPIGDILADLTRFVGLDFTQASVSYRITGVDSYWNNTEVYTTGLKQRMPFEGAPPIPKRFILGNGLNPKRCLDSLALLVGQFSKR